MTISMFNTDMIEEKYDMFCDEAFGFADLSSHDEITKSSQMSENDFVQVAALTRKGDGTRSEPVNVKTPGGVPTRPEAEIK